MESRFLLLTFTIGLLYFPRSFVGEFTVCFGVFLAYIELLQSNRHCSGSLLFESKN